MDTTKSGQSSKVAMVNKQADFINQLITNPLFIANQNPIAFIQLQHSDHIKFIAFNKKWHAAFPLKNKQEKPHHYFEKNFMFISKPVNISGSKEILKVFLKKTGQNYNAHLHCIENEYFYIEIINNEITEAFGYSSKKELYKILDLFPEIIFKLNTQLNFEYLNQHGFDILGFSRSDLNKNFSLKDIVFDKHYEQIHAFINDLSGIKKNQNKSIILKKANGGHGYFDIFFSAIVTGIDTISIWGIAIDITHKIKIEQKLLRAKTKVEDADRLKTVFLMNMSHEIRTPLNSVMGYTQLLMRKLKDPVLISYLQNVKNGGKELLKLFNDLMDLSKIYSDQLDIIESEVPLNRLLKKLKSEFKTAIDLDKKKIEVNIVCGLDDDNAHIMIDSERIQQIFNSLFSNSLKFTQCGSIEFGYEKRRGALHFFLKDTGKGIEPEIQKQIFDLFYQPELSTNGDNRGTGIGLAITKGIIEKMQGKVWLESAVDKGTMINFTLPYTPIYKSKGKQIIGNLNMECDLHKSEMLVIENKLHNLNILKEMLEMSNAQVSHTNTGKKAIELATSIPYRIIFIDINLSDINCLDLIQKLRQQPDRPIIIALSAFINNEDKAKCYSAGCDAFIEKPINQEHLLFTISSFLNKKSK